MLTPAQAILSALLTAIFVEFLTRRYGYNYEQQLPAPLEPETIKSPFLSDNLEIPAAVAEEPDEVNKLLDAIFVSHGVGIEPAEGLAVTENQSEQVSENQSPDVAAADTETVTAETITAETETADDPSPTAHNSTIAVLELTESNFDSLFTGNWLVLSHLPFHHPSARYLAHFLADYPDAVHNPLLRLATVDCNAHPLVAAALQVRQYPSLQMVTGEEGGRLREWPFEMQKLDQRTSWFLAHSQWSHLPVYQQLRPLDASLALAAIQIALFNKAHRLIETAQPAVYDWVLQHRPLTAGLLGVSAAALLFGRKAAHIF